jgi:hypothetical protein
LDKAAIRGKRSLDPRETEIPKSAFADLSDNAYVRTAIALALRTYVPTFTIPRDFFVEIVETDDDGFVASTNLDFDFINREYHKISRDGVGDMTLPFFLNRILEVRADILLTADYMSELDTDAINSAIIQVKFEDLFKKRFKSSADICLFQEVVLENSRAISDVIDSGERTFKELLTLLERAKRFKEEFLGTVNPDKNLLAEYLKAAITDTWTEKLPTKVVRFVVFSGAGLVLDLFAPGSSASLHAIDALLIDKCLKGWRPSHFVEAQLRTFVDGNPQI